MRDGEAAPQIACAMHRGEHAIVGGNAAPRPLAQYTGAGARPSPSDRPPPLLLKSPCRSSLTVDESVTGCDGSSRAFFRRFFVVILPAWRHNWAAPSAAHFVDKPCRAIGFLTLRGHAASLQQGTARPAPAQMAHMTAQSSLLDELERALAAGSDAQRDSMLSRVTDLFVDSAHRYSEVQIGLFDEVFTTLVSAIETKARAKLSIRLAEVPNAPAGVVRALAFADDID